MNTTHPEPARRLVYALLITVAAGQAAGRLLSAERVYEPSLHRAPSGPNEPPRPVWPATRPEPWPTFSSNDRSRWAAVRALVDEGTWVIGWRDEQGKDHGIVFEDGWQSVDKVLHPERQEFYSSKPPLLTLLAAGGYWALKHALGWSIVEQRWEVIRTLVFAVNIVPLILYLALLARLAERFGTTDWGRT